MKRSIAILIACMLFFPFCTACGDTAESSGGQQKSSRTEKQATETTEETTTEDNTEIVNTTEEITIPETTPPATEPPMPEYTIRPADWEDVQWTQYECLYFTLTISMQKMWSKSGKKSRNYGDN